MQRCTPEGRFPALQKLALDNGGFWPIPDAEPDQDCVYEVTLFGISTIRSTRDDVARDWMEAARRALEPYNPGTPEPEQSITAAPVNRLAQAMQVDLNRGAHA